MDNRVREQWVRDHGGLSLKWKKSRLSIKKFVRRYRHEIDRVIAKTLNVEELNESYLAPRS